MEKKTYIKPEMEVAELEIQSLMLTGSQDEIIFGEGFVNTEEEGTQLSIGRGTRRGKWGNLWYTED